MGDSKGLPKLGDHGNAWNNVATGIGGVSPAIDTLGYSFISAFGNVSGATTITIQYSQDGINWYDGPSATQAGAGNLTIDALTGARKIRLKSSANITATMTLAAK